MDTNEFIWICEQCIARRTAKEATITQLSERDRDLFLKLIETDAPPNEALKRAAKRYRGRRDCPH